MKWLIRGLLGAIVILSSVLIGYFVGFNQAEEDLAAERAQTKQLVDQIQQIASIDENYTSIVHTSRTQDEEIRKLKIRLKELLDQEGGESLKPQHEYAPKDQHALPPPSPSRPLRSDGTTPKLVIIIDDVSYPRDVRVIKSTGLPLVMSFLPPSPRHPDSALLAQQEAKYMVHLPMEALDYDAEEPSTLRVDDSEESITKRIEALKRLYPNVRYMNNHTGSKFTSDTEAMEKLIHVMKKEGIQFVDSRTTAQTKVPEVSREQGVTYIGRDVFLDHQDGVENVKKQIAEAVEKAKKHGSAIAIGHPRPDTIQALKESKSLLNEVELVGIEQI
ncbi:MAG: divergent polysaccharide deacetylase family protein [Sulfuricurvum sp.]|uniref:divergent polysaccharide deacetylase family protein n=1 Tax=Sulfuricurvum sp. TaxID=2025608 RepID=UPI003D131BE5